MKTVGQATSDKGLRVSLCSTTGLVALALSTLSVEVNLSSETSGRSAPARRLVADADVLAENGTAANLDDETTTLDDGCEDGDAESEGGNPGLDDDAGDTAGEARGLEDRRSLF